MSTSTEEFQEPKVILNNIGLAYRGRAAFCIVRCSQAVCEDVEAPGKFEVFKD